MNDTGKTLIVVGLVMAAFGCVLLTNAGRWLGRLPGDIHYQKGGTTVFFPWVTCLVVSVVLSLLLWLFRKI